ncbi:MAG: hypothetical protein P0119_13510 [Nitrospira sp.]|nr:hypothetical protein [Nitrospira sp.]
MNDSGSDHPRDPTAIIRHSQPGAVPLSRYRPRHAPDETSLLIREDTRHSSLVIDPLTVTLRLGLSQVEHVLLILLLINLATPQTTRLYEAWIDGINAGLGTDMILGDLAIQPTLRFFLFGSHGLPPRMFHTTNAVQGFTRQCLRQLKAQQSSWGPAVFERLRVAIRQQAGSTEALWLLLHNPSFPIPFRL